MKKKLLGILVCMLLITTALPVAGTRIDIKNHSIEKESDEILNDQIDQQQPTHNRNTFLIGEAFRAQSFVPTKNELTRVELFIYKEGTMNADFVVSIRDNLHGSDLTTVSKQANQIPSNIQSQDWIEFNFNKIQITPGNTYYIVCTTQGGNLDNCYVLGYAENDPYPLGDAWEYGIFTGYIWQKMDDYDLSFRTYVTKGKGRFEQGNQLFFHFLEQHLNLFPILQRLLLQLGLQ